MRIRLFHVCSVGAGSGIRDPGSGEALCRNDVCIAELGVIWAGRIPGTSRVSYRGGREYEILDGEFRAPQLIAPVILLTIQ